MSIGWSYRMAGRTDRCPLWRVMSDIRRSVGGRVQPTNSADKVGKITPLPSDRWDRPAMFNFIRQTQKWLIIIISLHSGWLHPSTKTCWMDGWRWIETSKGSKNTRHFRPNQSHNHGMLHARGGWSVTRWMRKNEWMNALFVVCVVCHRIAFYGTKSSLVWLEIWDRSSSFRGRCNC